MNNVDLSNFDKPWEKFYGEVPSTLDYPDETLYESIEKISNQYPDYFAYIFMGKKTKYKDFLAEINNCAKSLKSAGVNKGDIITIAMPNCPQALIMFYAINCVGAIANMVHPLSSESELEFYLNLTKSNFALTLDTFVSKFESILNKTTLEYLIVASIGDALTPAKKIAYELTLGRKINPIKKDKKHVSWKDFMTLGNNYKGDYKIDFNSKDDAVILYSGGTTGTPKGICLENFSLNVLATQLLAINPKSKAGDTVFSGMPIFHGFGLAMTCHGVLFNGGCCILVPRFDAKSVVRDVVKYKCTIIAGVPTLFEAILKAVDGKKYDLSFIKAVFCGGDSLPISLEKRFNKFLKDNNSNEKIRVGYGLTESVTAVTVSPDNHKSGSNGIPFPDTLIKIVIPGTRNDLPYGQTGEICVYGPGLMSGYLNNIEETDQVLQKHKDGRIWLHTGDLGYLDDEGFLFFVQRLKRMIISSGYNIYPTQLEKVFNEHEFVDASCIIGLPDDYRGQKVKAFIKLNKDVEKSECTKQNLMEYAKLHIAKYALPSEIEFRDDLPTTIIGKVDYKVLENEELSKL